MVCRVPQTLVKDALTAAYWKKKPKPGLLHHSDRGSQYRSAAYRALQSSYGMLTSMSRKGSCRDNAPMESFLARLKLKVCIIIVLAPEIWLNESFFSISRSFIIVFDAVQK